MAGGQRLRCREDRRDPGRADVPARRHDAVPHRLCGHGERPRQRAAGAGRRGACVLAAGFSCRRSTAIVLAVSLALSVVWTPQGPLVDSLALSGVRRFGSNYTGMRIWGSISFLAANLVGGIILSWTSPQAVPVIMTASLGVGLLTVLIAPRMGKPRRASPLSVEELQARAKTAQPLLRAVRHGRRRHQRQPRLHVRIRLDLLEVGRARRHADGLPLGVRRGLGSVCVSGLHAVCSAAFGRPRC